MTQLDEFDSVESLSETQFYSVSLARDIASGTAIHLLQFSSEISSSQGFRAAFRKDVSLLQNLRHWNIVPVLKWGECDGQLFYVMQAPRGDLLSQRLSLGQSFSWDEVTDIGWQIASAIQHSHNVGLVHGRLTTECVYISDQIRAETTGFGLHRWVTASRRPAATTVSTADTDLVGLGQILDLLIQNVSAEDRGIQAEPMKQLIVNLASPHPALSARDVQGQLGNMLLRESGEAIDMVDHRKGQNLSRRSIVDELFDERPATVSASHSIRTDSRPLGLVIFCMVVGAIVCGIAILASL